MIFMRDFFDENHKVNTKNTWVWYLHLLSYLYIIYVYFFTNAINADVSQASQMWIPLDILLTMFIFIYQVVYKFILEEDPEAQEQEQVES